jgi:hypothetical protein
MGAHRYRPQRNWGARIHETQEYGMRVVVLENQTLRLSILADKGADLIEWNYKPLDLDCVWLSADGVRDPRAALATAPDAEATFLDTYPGGWQEVFPNGGIPSQEAGARFGQHGEVSLLPWDYAILADTAEEVAVQFTVRTQRSPYDLTKTFHLTRTEPRFTLTETITNTSGVALRAMWGHHITFGTPFLAPDTQVRLPPGIRGVTHADALFPHERRLTGNQPFIWPLAQGGVGQAIDLSRIPAPGTPSELVYLHDFGDEGWYELASPAHPVTVRVAWDARVLPYLWFWQEYGATTSYPWYGRHYNIGLEPFSSYPTLGIAEAVRNGTALTFAPHETKALTFAAHIVPQ